MFECLQDFSPGQVEISKVAAHRRVADALSPLEEWCVVHNGYADQAACLAQWSRPQEFWNLFDQHVSATIACMRFSRVVQNVSSAHQ